MIQFFRKIRQKLLSEKKVRNYLVYAIGEVLLVVIGILIALSINNWNDARKDRLRESYLLKELQKEFAKDSSQLSRYIFLTEMKAKEGILVKDYLKGKKVAKDSVINNAFFNGKLLVFKSFTPTYDEMIATGQQNIIRNDTLKDLIKEYKDFLNDQEEFLLNECKAIKQNYNFHLYKYFERGIMVALWNHATLEKRYMSIDSLGDFIKDIEGFRSDPKSLYYVTMNMGADADINRSYKNNLKPRLDRILNALRVINK